VPDSLTPCSVLKVSNLSEGGDLKNPSGMGFERLVATQNFLDLLFGVSNPEVLCGFAVEPAKLKA
jgi:hypothetical protein